VLSPNAARAPMKGRLKLWEVINERRCMSDVYLAWKSLVCAEK
jgi:hypothetical protein